MASNPLLENNVRADDPQEKKEKRDDQQDPNSVPYPRDKEYKIHDEEEGPES
jgi:hypothetical protein